MSFPKVIILGSISLFLVIGVVGLVKKKREGRESLAPIATQKEEVEKIEPRASEHLKPVSDEITEQEVDQVYRLFTKGKQKHPLVETIRYKSQVPWLQGRPAWVTDYASHYGTSRHFIARSLNGKRDYTSQKISQGDQFNVLIPDLSFYLVVDLSRCKMWFYALGEGGEKRYLLKTYRVGLGRFDERADSGILTPKGKFSLGDRVAIYKEGMTGYFQESEVEMVRVFGTRWIPFSEELTGEGESLRGYGFHGAPWVYDLETSSYKEDLSTIGSYESDGCIRLSQLDIEELYSIVITKPTTVEIVTDFHDASLPGQAVEVQ